MFYADIQAINRAKNKLDIPQAQDALDYSSALLATIEVSLLPFRGGKLQAHVYAGRDDQRT